MYIYSFIIHSWKCNNRMVHCLQKFWEQIKTHQAECSIAENYYGRGLLIQSRACRSAGMKAGLQSGHPSLEWIITGHMGGFTAFVTGFNPRPGVVTILVMMGVREKTRFYQHKGRLYILPAHRQLGWKFWLNNAQTSGFYEEYMSHEHLTSKNKKKEKHHIRYIDHL